MIRAFQARGSSVIRKFIQELRERGELSVVQRRVDPRHELAAVTKRFQKVSEQALLFESVEGSDLSVATNLYGSHARLCRLIGAGDSFCRRWNELVQGPAAFDPGQVTVEAPADRDSGRLSDLPMITYHGKDAGPYITSAIFLAKDPDTGVPNLSFHRSMYVSDDELRIRLGSSHDLAKYQARAEARGEPLEAAILVGTRPEIFLAACASPPTNVSELDIAAKIAGEPIEMYACDTIDLEVPAGTEVVVEGRILPNVRRPEGPFGEFLGFYVPVGDNHVFEVQSVNWRKSACWHGLLCGSPEDLRPLEAVTAARIYAHVSNLIPGVIDVSCRPNVMITILKLRKQYKGHGKHALLAALGSHMDFNKVCIVVDEDVDIFNLDDVMWAYLARGRADKRATVLEDIPGFYRDPNQDHWGRLIIDATIPWGREDEFQRKAVPGEESINLADYLSAPDVSPHAGTSE
ncbi:MAG TPA: UbiD family decarboxylase [Woeseiaceae bacterium]|nr:UbiD family decarboxylase [Woeseiaceae bacterium]